MTESSKPPFGRRMKARAPPPPQAPLPAPRHIFKNTDGGGTSSMEAKENMLRPTVEFELTLPQGYKVPVTEEGSKALMDLLVELCSRYHLNPALHTLELLSPEGHPLGFKPNALLGSLNVACVLIKEKVWEEKVVRKTAPKVPEKTVRLMVNYHRSQKAVLRVNPLLTLQALTPVICDKCELDPAHVLLLKDSISRHVLPLDKSLAELGIKELYVHDKSLVLQPKMASAPALNYSDYISSSTTSLGRTEKKGLLGIFQFNRKKSKTETSSVDMDQCDDKVIQNTDIHPNGLSTVTNVHNIEGQQSTLSQSQSVVNMSRMSPMAEIKKRRAPAPPEAPTPSMEHSRFEGYQMGLDSENQQRKRKAPAPPPTPASITASSDAPTLVSHAETPTSGFRTKVADSVPVSSTSVIMQTIKQVPKKKASQPAPATTSSPTPSWSTTSSQAIQDSSSDLSHSLDDSDVDLDQAASHCSTLTSSTMSGSVQVHPNMKSSSGRVKATEKSNSMAAKSNQEVTSDASSKSDTESALNLKLDEVENKRHSAMGITVQPAPPKPRRSPARESPQLTPTPTTSPPPSPLIEPTEINPQESPTEAEEAAPQSWLNSMRSTTANDKKIKSETPEEETMSLGSSSGNSSLPDQGYAASEGMAECEDSGIVSSPSDTQPTSPDGSLSLDGGGRLLDPIHDNFSDSDEGCATWGSRRRCKDISPQSKSGRLKDSYDADPELRAQLHQTLADFEADLAGHIDIVSVRETSYTMSTNSNDVPVSVVDMDVPVTAIDEVLEDYESNFVEKKAKSITRPESTGTIAIGSCHQSSTEPQNKNNNACTAADSSKSSSASTKQPPQPDQHEKPLVNKSISDKEKEKIVEANIKAPRVTDTKRVKEDKHRTTSAVKSDVDVKKHRKSTEDKPAPVKSNTQSFQEKKPVSPQASQRPVPTERTEETRVVNQNNSSSNTSHGKITCNAVSRFGMRTFTVVPPKPAVTHAATGNSAVTVTAGAIKIDDQGNMVKVGISKDRVGGSAQSGMNCSEGSPLLGKAKAFWSSSHGKEDNSKSQTNKAKVNVDGLKSSPSSISETTKKTSDTENRQTTKNIQRIPEGSAQSKEQVKEKAKERVKDIHTEKVEEVENKTSVSKNVQQPNNKPTLPTTLFPDLNRDLYFLKPSRRTSSHYVASALNKYTPKTSAKTDSIPTIHDSSVSVKTQAAGFQRSGRSVQVNPLQSSRSSLSDNKEIESASKPNPSGPTRSISYPEHVSQSQRDPGEVRPDRGAFGSNAGSTKGSSNALQTETAKNKCIQSSGPTQINVTSSNGRDNFKAIRPRSPSPAHPVHSSAKPSTVSKTSSPSTTKDVTKVVTNPTLDARPQPSVTVSDSDDLSQPVTVFGPVKKFRPVICKSVDKETSLHSSLMEAIQTGGGRDRLKKISTTSSSGMKKMPHVEEQSERSALLSAIRDQSSSSRLRKTTSEAADELMKFRKATSEEVRSADPATSLSPSLTSTSTSAFKHQPPTPPPVPTVAPPPPPPVLPPGKPSTVAHPSANTAVNPALAREAMLEAIRSGTAAERLKKVAAPTKTVQVNGRLGTIQANSSALP